MAYTLEELQKMGAKPVAPAASSPAPTMSAPVQATSSQPKRKYTPQELQSLGAKPVASAPAPTPAPANNGVKGGIVGEILTGNTQRFGKTIGEALNAPNAANQFAETTDMLSKTRNDVVKRIAEKRQRGEDTSRLENALKLLEEDMPKLEDFTGDVINKTAGQVLGEAGGTALEILPFGTYGKATKAMQTGQLAEKVVAPTVATATKKLVTKPSTFLTKEGGKQALEGAAFGYGVDVTQGLQEGEGASAFKPGLGTAIGAVAPAAVKAVGVGAKKVGTALADRAARAAGEADNLLGTIIQGEAKDIPAARRAFTQIDTEGIRTYGELKDALNAKIKTGSEKLREALGYEEFVKPLDELTLTSKIDDITISKNFVDDAINQLEDYYTKTGSYEDAARMQALKRKAQSQGITVQEINDLAIRHGQDLSGFNASGELASGLKKQMAENTRSGLKRTARDQFKSKVYDETDAALSDLIKTRDLVTDMEEAVLKLQQKTRDASIGERVGVLAEQVLNFVTFGTSRGFLQSGRDLGLFKAKTTMTAIEMQERLAKNLKRLNEIIDGPENQMEKKLDAFLKENKIPPVAPAKINLKQPPKVYAPPVSAKTSKDIEIGITSFRGKPVKTIAQTGPYYLSPRAKGFEKSLKNPTVPVKVGDIRKVAGSWEGSIEPSFSVTTSGKLKDVMAYAVENAKKANQDAVILFKQGTGNGMKYSFKVEKNPDAALKKLHAQGVSGATVDGKNITVYDGDGSLASAVEAFSKLIGVTPQKTNGTVKLIFKNDYSKYTGGSGGGGIRNSVRPKSSGSKGSASIGGLAAGALGLGAVGALMTPSTMTYTRAPEEPNQVEEVREIPPQKLATALMALESSGGKDKSSADPGEKKWLTGLTDVAIKELKRLGRLRKDFNKNIEEHVLEASVEYFKLMQEKHPDLSPAEIYTDKYWTQWKRLKDPQNIRQKKIDQFNELVTN